MYILKFRQAGVFEILFWLEKQELKITDIKKDIHQETAYKALNVLLDLKLIEVERREYNAKYYCLTEKGKKVATKLAEIEKILQED